MEAKEKALDVGKTKAEFLKWKQSWNDGNRLADHLKPQHVALFGRLTDLMLSCAEKKHRIDERKMVWPTMRTSKAALASDKALGVHVKTMDSYFDRLKKAGCIHFEDFQKDSNRKPDEDFLVSINPMLIVYYEPKEAKRGPLAGAIGSALAHLKP